MVEKRTAGNADAEGHEGYISWAVRILRTLGLENEGHHIPDSRKNRPTKALSFLVMVD